MAKRAAKIEAEATRALLRLGLSNGPTPR